jgi:hypothetical protein
MQTDLPIGALVDSYCDLHRRCTSLRCIAGERRGRVIGKADTVVLQDVTFRVNPGGLRRVREEGVRAVHAYARGTVVSGDAASVRDHPDAIRVRYNPFQFDSFVRADTEAPIAAAAVLAIDGKEAFALLQG